MRALGTTTSQELTFGPDGNLYVPNSSRETLQRFDGQTGKFLGNIIVGNLTESAGFIFLPIPEPETYAMLLAGLGLVGLLCAGESKPPNIDPGFMVCRDRTPMGQSSGFSSFLGKPYNRA
ncbi:MAG TPA: PEP-CTERM sorting domain-containing protein [Nitrosospira sp.]|nr:PEP-CTERM sorting domain-containing protein [Nitrosospira sp.]